MKIICDLRNLKKVMKIRHMAISKEFRIKLILRKKKDRTIGIKNSSLI